MDLFTTSTNLKLVIACSGGPDSMYLIDRLHNETDHTLHVVHVHHGLRKEADIDEKIVQDYCQENNLTYQVEYINTNELKKKYKTSIEEAGRIERRKILESSRVEKGYDYIVTGHHKDDLVETLIYRIIRGTRIHGLIGIRKKEGKYIRPLLEIEKNEIFTYLANNDISFVIEESNNDINYDRNRIRHNIIPEYKEINSKYRENIIGLARYAEEYESFLEDTFREEYEKKSFSKNWYKELHKHMQKQWIHFIYKKENAGTIGISERSIAEMDRFIQTANGGTKKEVGKLRLTKKNNVIYINQPLISEKEVLL